jgi:hypothetical protein
MSAQQLRTFDNRAILINLEDMPIDMKRVLRIQWKELIHTVEDYELAKGLQRRPDRFSGSQAA